VSCVPGPLPSSRPRRLSLWKPCSGFATPRALGLRGDGGEAGVTGSVGVPLLRSDGRGLPARVGRSGVGGGFLTRRCAPQQTGAGNYRPSHLLTRHAPRHIASTRRAERERHSRSPGSPVHRAPRAHGDPGRHGRPGGPVPRGGPGLRGGDPRPVPGGAAPPRRRQGAGGARERRPRRDRAGGAPGGAAPAGARPPRPRDGLGPRHARVHLALLPGGGRAPRGQHGEAGAVLRVRVRAEPRGPHREGPAVEGDSLQLGQGNHRVR